MITLTSAEVYMCTGGRPAIPLVLLSGNKWCLARLIPYMLARDPPGQNIPSASSYIQIK